MNQTDKLCVKLIHCGNVDLTNPGERAQRNVFFMPMGLFALGGVLRDEGFNVEILHSDLEYDKDISSLLDINAVDAIGLDCHWVNQAAAVFNLAEAIKKIKPEVFVFLGGFTASFFSTEIIKDYLYIDASIRGDGEVPIVELCRLLDKRKRYKSLSEDFPDGYLKNVQNLVWRGSDGRVNINAFSYKGAGDEMGKLDFAAVQLLRNWENYRRLSTYHSNFKPIGSQPMFLLEIGRGCQYACSFCGGNCEAQKAMNNRAGVAVRPAESIVSTVKKAAEMGFKTLYVDFEFEGSDEWYVSLLKRIREEVPGLCLGFGCWRLPSRDLIDALSHSFTQAVIQLSPETSDHRLRMENKDARLFYTNGQLEECLDYINTKSNIKAQVFFGYYVAHDTPETILDTIRYILKLLVKYHGLMEIEYGNFSTDPGSLFYLYPEKYDIKMDVRCLKDYINISGDVRARKGPAADMTLFRPEDISDEDAAAVERRMELFNYLFNTYRGSISYCLQKIKDGGPVVDILLDEELQVSRCSALNPDRVKSVMMRCFDNIMDENLYNCIKAENDRQKHTYTVSKPTTTLYLEGGYEQPVDRLFEDGDMDLSFNF